MAIFFVFNTMATTFVASNATSVLPQNPRYRHYRSTLLPKSTPPSFCFLPPKSTFRPVSCEFPNRAQIVRCFPSDSESSYEEEQKKSSTEDSVGNVDPTPVNDEWDKGSVGSGSLASTSDAVEVEEKKYEEAEDMEVEDLKRCLVDSFYGTELGLKATAEVRAEVFELVNQLEAKNPTPAPTEAFEVLDGNWILLYTASSELLPLIAVGSTPFLNVKRISQVINTTDCSILNVVTLSNSFASFTFSASATFEVRSPSRIQVKFVQGILQPPEISSNVNLPENIDVFGQKIELMSLQGVLKPVQQAAASIAGVISGQPPLKVAIPGEGSSSWLLTSYLDKDLRISRGDVGLFILVKEGSPLLDQL
ncbi:Plastid lipid-associated protein 3, chloroplastic [Zostera marina]|uniref:Plastid lipid-associated protein 3, chloroplastic n=1 Tax=Zostera marina TaxID=29655 RepID=A0A0K9PEF5_ZOSMR|nr:Plastid lipid-associated protein 3, chloroplastic [Zostera marina]